MLKRNFAFAMLLMGILSLTACSNVSADIGKAPNVGEGSGSANGAVAFADIQDTEPSQAEIAAYEAEAARIARYSKFAVGDYSDTLMIGDSIMVISSWSLKDFLPGVSIDACSGRSLESGGVAEGGGSSDGVLDHVRALDPASYSRYVIGTGSNDGSGMAYDDGLEIVDNLGSDCEIWFVTELVTNNPRGTANTNESIRRLAAEFDNIRIVDWHAVVSPSPETYLADNCHPGTQEAMDLYASLVKDGLDSVVL